MTWRRSVSRPKHVTDCSSVCSDNVVLTETCFVSVALLCAADCGRYVLTYRLADCSSSSLLLWYCTGLVDTVCKPCGIWGSLVDVRKLAFRTDAGCWQPCGLQGWLSYSRVLGCPISAELSTAEERGAEKWQQWQFGGITLEYINSSLAALLREMASFAELRVPRCANCRPMRPCLSSHHQYATICCPVGQGRDGKVWTESVQTRAAEDFRIPVSKFSCANASWAGDLHHCAAL